MAGQQRFLEPHERGHAWSWSTSRADEPSDAEQAANAFRVGDDLDTPVYVISVAADLAELHPQTLRAYEREGLLTPARTEGGTRRYSQRDVERLRFIRRLTQDEGLNLAGVKVVLELGEKLEGARSRVRELEEMVRVLADRIDDRPASERFEIVKAAPTDVEVHQLRRRTGERGRPATRPRSAGERRPADV